MMASIDSEELPAIADFLNRQCGWSQRLSPGEDPSTFFPGRPGRKR